MYAPCLTIHDAAVKLAPTPAAWILAHRARRDALLAADEAEYLADPAGYRMQADARDVAGAGHHTSLNY